MTPGESPFFANYGIPAQQSIVTQMYPDFYVALLQSQFAQYFASLSIKRISGTITNSSPITTWGLQTLNNVYKSDWQGRQLQYSTPRTKYAPNNDSLNLWTTYVTGTGACSVVQVTDPQLGQVWRITKTAGAAGDRAGISINIGGLSGSNYIASVYAKPGTLGVQGYALYCDAAKSGGGLVTVSFLSSSLPAGWSRPNVVGSGLLAGTAVYYIFLAGVVGDYIDVKLPELELGTTLTSAFATTAAPATVTDYSIVGNNIIFANPPLAKAILDWSGTATSNMGDVQNFYQSTFGIGDGVKTAFPLNLPASSGKVPGPEYDIKIVRNNGSIFNTVIAV